MKIEKIKYFTLGCISTIAMTGVVYGVTQLSNVYLSPFIIKLNGEEYVNEMPVLNYQDRTYLALRELGTVLGNEIDFVNNEIIINTNKENKSVSGVWSVKKALQIVEGKEVEVSLRDIYGSSASLGCGDLTLNDQSFTDYIQPVYSTEDCKEGKYEFKENKIILTYDNNVKKELIYNEADSTIRYSEGEEYILVLVKNNI